MFTQNHLKTKENGMKEEEKNEFTDFVTSKVNLIINDAVAKQNK